jgi:hypothetical protein
MSPPKRSIDFPLKQTITAVIWILIGQSIIV